MMIRLLRWRLFSSMRPRFPVDSVWFMRFFVLDILNDIRYVSMRFNIRYIFPLIICIRRSRVSYRHC